MHQYVFVVCIDWALAPLCLENRERRSVNYVHIVIGNEACAHIRADALLGSIRVGLLCSDRSNNWSRIDTALRVQRFQHTGSLCHAASHDQTQIHSQFCSCDLF